jgi:6-phosphogluconolactonase (cycloisomerase 2 family)
MDQTRRTFLRGAAALAGPLPQRTPPAVFYAYVGCFTTEQRRARGDGIHVYRMDPATGAWSHLQHVGNLVNPSFLILSRDQRFLYSAHGDEKYATSFAVDNDTGRLTLLNRADTGGGNGAHHALDPSGRFLVVANYASGTVAVLPVRKDGSLADQIQLADLQGEPGPHRVEQTSSHPHHVVFDPSGRFVAVPDKGLDRVFVFRFDQATGRLSPTEQGSVRTRSGYAPRHAAFHPTLPVAWVINELGSTTTTYRFDPRQGALRPVQILPSTPPDYTGGNTGSEILVSADGRFVYCSNRGHDSIAVYATDPKTGLLTSTGWTPTQGRGPRFISLDPSQRFLYAANEQGDTVVTFRVDGASGRLTPTGQVVQTASPATIAFAGHAGGGR